VRQREVDAAVRSGKANDAACRGDIGAQLDPGTALCWTTESVVPPPCPAALF
jgi:hypothetical protein